MYKKLELARLLVAWPPSAGSVTSTEGSSSSSLHPAAALHHLVLSVQRAGQRLRRPCVDVAATATDGTHTQVSTVTSSLKPDIGQPVTLCDSHPDIPPRPMWLCPGMAPSLSAVATRTARHKSHQNQRVQEPARGVTTLNKAESLLLCHCRSPSIFRPESQSRPPSLEDKQCFVDSGGFLK